MSGIKDTSLFSVLSISQPTVVEVSLEDTSISVNESEGTFMACVVKDRDTVFPVKVDILDLGQGSALTAIGE